MSESGKSPDFSNLTENLSQQQAKISALKELVRQSESQQGKNAASAQEKVKNIAQRLSNLKSKTAKSKLRSTSDLSDGQGISNIEEEQGLQLPETLSTSTPYLSQGARSETPGSEKITLLRKQMELNRAKMAERETKSREIEQMVTQLKSKFETSQLSLEKSVELGRSMGDLSSISIAPLHSHSFSDVSHSSRVSMRDFSLENERIKFLEKRIRELEGTISYNKKMTESDRVQELQKNILDLEENLREKESVIDARTKAVSLLSENLTKKKKDVVDSLEDTKQEMFKMQETFLETESTYKAEVDRLNRVIDKRSHEIQNVVEKCDILEKSRYDLTIENSELKTKLEDVHDYSAKISELNKLNETLQLQLSNKESQNYEMITEEEVGAASFEESGNSRSELLEKIKTLEELAKSRNREYEELEEMLQEKIVEFNVVNANFSVLQEKYNSIGTKPLFLHDQDTDNESHTEIARLKHQLDDSNKSMIKTKLKIKQLQKQVDMFKKAGTSTELVRLTEENQALIQQIAELVDYKNRNQNQEYRAGNELENQKKIEVLEATCQNQTIAIQLLEEQKIDMAADIQNARLELDTGELKKKLDALEELNISLEQKVEKLSSENAAVEEKLARYVNENIELHDKIEKLSKGSSAESIEMVNLTAQDNEEYQKALGYDAGPEISQELNESLRSLREESSELMSKIELFTIERREVLDKLDALSIDNQVLVSTIEAVKHEKQALEHENITLRENFEKTDKILSELQTDKTELAKNYAELIEHSSKLQEEINTLTKGGFESLSHSMMPKLDVSEVAGSKPASLLVDEDACRKLLIQLDTEIQNLNRNKDKHQKLKISKKLSDCAKSVHTTMTALLEEYSRNCDEIKQLKDVSEKSLAISTSNVDKGTEELIVLRQKLNETEEKLSLQNESNLLEMSRQGTEYIEELQGKIQTLNFELNDKNEFSEKLQTMVDTLSQERDVYKTEVQSQKSLVNDLRKEFDQLRVNVKVNNQRLNEKSLELDQLQREFDMRLKTSTNEVDILKTLAAEQKQLLIDSYQEHELDINQKIKEINDYQTRVESMENELTTLRGLHASDHKSDLNAELTQLKILLNEKSQLVDEHREELLYKQETIDTLNSQIIELYKSMEENSSKIIEKEDEIQYLKEINKSGREEIESLHQKLSKNQKTISDLQDQLNFKNSENEKLQQSIDTHSEASNRARDLENDVKALEGKNKDQLEKLKKFAANLKKKQARCAELEEKIAANAGDISVIELRAQYEQQINTIKNESSDVIKNLQKSNDEINEMKQKIKQYEGIISEISTENKELKDKLNDSLMGVSDANSKLIEVTLKLEANQLECARLQATSEETDAKDKLNDKKMDKLKVALVQLKHKFAEKSEEAANLTEELNKLKSLVTEGHSRENLQLQEMSLKILEETKSAYKNDIAILQQKIADLEASNYILNEDKQRKVSLEGQLETFEMINVQLQNRIAILEESVASYQSENNCLQQEKISMGSKLEEMEKAANQQMDYSNSETLRLTQTIDDLISENNILTQKLAALEIQWSLNLEKKSENISNLENDNSQLHQRMQLLEGDLKNAQITYELSLAAKHNEVDEMEAELSSQLNKIEIEKKTIKEALEKANEQIFDFQDEIVRMKENTHSLEQSRADLEQELSWLKLQNENYTHDQLENEQLRMQLMQSETENENLRSQNENIHENHQFETIVLKQQIVDLETMRSHVSQNQTDDQVMLQNENIKLKELLLEKESEIQHKKIQLQMVSTFDSSAANDVFANLIGPSSEVLSDRDSQEKMRLKEKLVNAEEEIRNLREAFAPLNIELEVNINKVHDLVSENKDLRTKTVEMQSLMDSLIRTDHKTERFFDQQNQVNLLNKSTDDRKLELLETQLTEKNTLIQHLQGRLHKYEGTNVISGAISCDPVQDNVPPPTSLLFDDPVVLQSPEPQEVIEEFIQPKKAYLLFEKVLSVGTQTDDNYSGRHEETKNTTQQLQAQIQTMNQRFLEQSTELDHQKEKIISYQQRIRELELSNQPSVDEQALNLSPKTLDQSHSMAALEIEDGWGWGASESIENQQEEASSMSTQSDLIASLKEQRGTIERLEKENVSLNEEISNIRESSKKMMKKLKEYQTKIKDLEQITMKKSSSKELSDIDLVIQEELTSRIQKLEETLKDLKTEKNKELQEKEALLKRVDVLTAANERLIESKEHQDKQMEIYQFNVRELNQKLLHLEDNKHEDEKFQENRNQATDISQQTENQTELLKKIQLLNDQLKDMKVDFDETQALLDEEKANTKILEEKLVTLNSLKLQDSSKDQEINNLTRLLNESCEQRESMSQQNSLKDQEIRDLIRKIDLLSNESSNIKTILDDLGTQIQLKVNENQELNQRLQNLAASNDDLSRERQIYNDSVEQNFHKYSHDLEQELQAVHAELQYKNSQIHQLNTQISELSSELSQAQSIITSNSSKDGEILSLQTRLMEIENQNVTSAPTAMTEDLKERVLSLEKVNRELLEEKNHMEHELQVLNDQVLASLEFEDKMKNTVLELDAKNIEIQLLKSSLENIQPSLADRTACVTNDELQTAIEKLQHEKEELSQSMKSTVDLLNAQWSQAVEQRGNEVANSWKQHLEARETEFGELERNLRIQLSHEPEDPSENVHDDMFTGTVEKMKSIMENQEVEIVSLKEQLAIRSAEYASLSARVDPYHQLSTSMNVSPIPPDNDKVPRSELDLALYMLHQRDMRLEEMTMELVRLLDERDQLQLRLSNSIRQNEEVKKKHNVLHEADLSDISNATTPEKLLSAVKTIDDGEDELLQAKLSELNTVRQMRDKSIQNDREKRFQENILMLQRDVANIPPEAAARIVAGSSDQGQSPSSVLMNWFLGKNSESSS